MEIHPSDETKLIIDDEIISKDQSPSSKLHTTTKNPQRSSWRPRILYAVVFTWLAFTGGRFTAPFLKNEIGGYLNNDSIIGFLLACQNISSAIASPFFSNLADRYERQIQYGQKRQGRLFILKIALAVGSLATLLHSAPTSLFGDGSSSALFGNKRNKYLIISWHLFLRILYSFSLSVVFPVMDGITLSFLQQEQQERQQSGNRDDDSKVDDENESSESSAYGKERLHGAIVSYYEILLYLE